MQKQFTLPSNNLLLILLISFVTPEYHKIQKDESYPRAIALSPTSFFCFTNTSTFIYDFLNQNPISNKQNFDTPFSQDIMEKYNMKSINSQYILVCIKNLIIKYDLNGNILKTIIMQEQTYETELEHTICELSNGKAIISFITDNFETIKLYLFDGNNEPTVSFSHKIIVENANYYYSFTSNVECLEENADYFVCFFFGGYNPNFLFASRYSISDLDSKKIESKLSTYQGHFISVVKHTDSIFVICYVTGNPNIASCISFNKDSFSFENQIFTIDNFSEVSYGRTLFQITKSTNNRLIFIIYNSNKFYVRYIEPDLTFNGVVNSLKLTNIYQNVNLHSYLLLGTRETIIFSNDNDTNLFFFENHCCYSICLVRESNVTEVLIPFPPELASIPLFFLNPEAATGELKFPNKTRLLVNESYTIDENISYVVKDQSTTVTDGYDYFIENKDSVICQITIYNDESLKCQDSNPVKIQYEFEGNYYEVCPEYTMHNDTHCYKCNERGLWWYNSECVDKNSLLIPTFISDSKFNVLSKCDDSCASCNENAFHCLSCYEPFKLNADNKCEIVNEDEKKDEKEEENEDEVEKPDILIKETNESLIDITENLDETVENSRSTAKTTILQGDNFTIEISNSSSTKANLQLSSIDFSECGNILRKHYNLTPKDHFTFVKIDLDKRDSLINQVEYAVYGPDNSELNMSLCIDVNIKVTYTIKNSSLIDYQFAQYYADLGIDVFNANDDFFNYICFPFTTEKGTDITLKDRRKVIYQNLSLCEDNCEYETIDLNLHEVTCVCSVKTKINTKINLNFFYSAFKSTFVDSNFSVVECYHLILDMSITLKNLGFWLFLCLMFLHIPCFIMHCCLCFNPLYQALSREKANPKRKGKQNEFDNKMLHSTSSDYNSELKLFRERNKPKHNQNNQNYNHNHNHYKINYNLYKLDLNQNDLYRNNIIYDDDISQEENYAITDKYKKVTIYNKRSFNPITFSEPDNNNNNNKLPISSCNTSKKTTHNNFNPLKCSLYNSNISNGNNNNRFYYPTYENSNRVATRNKNIPDISSKVGFNYDFTIISRIAESNNGIMTHIKKRRQTERKIKEIKERDSTNSIYNDKKRKIIYTISSKGDISGKNSQSSALLENSTKLKTSQCDRNKIPFKSPSKDHLDDYNYNSAILYDNRSFCKIYYLCLLIKHQVLFTFVYKSPFELKAMQIILLIFSYSLSFALNALFYRNSMISKRYYYEGKLGFLFTLQNGLFISMACSAVSLIIKALLYFLSNSKSSLEKIQIEENIGIYKSLENYYLRILKRKIAFFIIIELFLMLFCWYYVSCFCAVFQGSQKSWLEGCSLSLIIDIATPFGVALLIAILRYVALKKRKPKLYKLSIMLYKI